MSPTVLLFWAAALIAFGLLARRGSGPAKRALRDAGGTLKRMLPMFAIALPMAALLAELVPASVAEAWLGPESGLSGILVASLAGAVIPGGPFVSFPMVLIFAKAGAGVPQMVALISGWSVLALHRAFVWEFALVGPRFVLIRLLAGGLAAPVAGLLAELLLPLFPEALAHL